MEPEIAQLCSRMAGIKPCPELNVSSLLLNPSQFHPEIIKITLRVDILLNM